MDIVGIIIVRYVFAFIGSIVRFIFENLFLLFKGQKQITFKNIWSGKGKFYDQIENDTANTIIGLVLFLILATLIVKNNW